MSTELPEEIPTPSAEPTKYCVRCSTSKPHSEFNKYSRSKDGLQAYCRTCINQYQRDYHVQNKDKKQRYYAARKRKRRAREASERFREAHPDAQRVYRAGTRAAALGIAGRFTEEEWIELQEYYEYHCLSCLKQMPGELEADHVIPLKQGGVNDITNIQPLCVSCNRQKGTRNVDFRPRWERERAGNSLANAADTIVIVLDYNREVESSHRWMSEEFGQNMSLRIPKEVLKVPHGRIRVVIEKAAEDLSDEPEGDGGD